MMIEMVHARSSSDTYAKNNSLIVKAKPVCKATMTTSSILEVFASMPLTTGNLRLGEKVSG